MEEITDTQRLDFVLNRHIEMDFDWRTSRYWIVFHTEVNGVKRKVVAVSDSYRTAIDKALTGAFEVVD